MKVKGTILRTRMEFLLERYGDDAPARLLGALSEGDRRAVEAALPGSWISFPLANRVDEAVARTFAGNDIGVCREIGAFSAKRNLATVYRMFVDQSGGDPHRLMENLSNLHGIMYDWGWTRATRVADTVSRLEGDYEGAATRANCLTAVGFYAEALQALDIGASVEETGCQVDGAPLCAYTIRWGA